MRLNTTIAEFKSTKSFRFAILGVPVILAVYLLGDHLLNMHNEINVASTCIKTYENGDYCNFACTFETPTDTVGRVFVTHTAWASIYETRLNLTGGVPQSVRIQLPKRTFDFYMRATFWNRSSTDKYGTAGGWLRC